MTNAIAFALIAVVAALAFRRARNRWGSTSSSGTALQLWRRAWPSPPLSWGQIEKRILGRMLGSVTPGVGGRVLVPGSFTVTLSVADRRTLGDALPLVVDGLRRELTRRAADKGWVLTVDPVEIVVLVDADAYDGAPRVDAAFAAGVVVSGAADPDAIAAEDATTWVVDPEASASATIVADDDSRTVLMLTSEVHITDGTGQDRRVPLPPSVDRVTVGRSAGVDVHLAPATVSGHHLAFVREGAAWTVADLGSTNGTYLNGTRVLPGVAAPLHDGDEVRIGRQGPACRFVRVVPGSATRPA